MSNDERQVERAAMMAQSAAIRHGGGFAAIRHGGDLAAASSAFPDARQPWIDLSTGINPWSYPVPPLPADAWARLPAAADEQALRQAAAACFGAPDANAVLAAPGTQALIQLLPRLLNGESVAVLSPTYAEHAAAWRTVGRDLFETVDLSGARHADIIVIVNPNNPDGRIVAAETLLDLARRQAARGGWLVVDEAFADATPERSIAAHAGRPGLVILRSFGKFFGLAGARLGFLLAEPALMDAARRALGPWAVSGPALAVGRAAYQDAAWMTATRARLADAATRLDALLIDKGLTVIGGTPLFRLVDCGDGAALFRRLAAAGIWSRPFANLPHAVRLGLPPDEASLARLKAAL